MPEFSIFRKKKNLRFRHSKDLWYHGVGSSRRGVSTTAKREDEGVELCLQKIRHVKRKTLLQCCDGWENTVFNKYIEIYSKLLVYVVLLFERIHCFYLLRDRFTLRARKIIEQCNYYFNFKFHILRSYKCKIIYFSIE